METIDELKNEIQKDIAFHAGEVSRYKKYDQIWRVLIVIIALSNGVLALFADSIVNIYLNFTYKLWVQILPCVMSINAIFNSTLQIDENQRLYNEKRNLLVQIKTELMKPENDRIPLDAFYEQSAEALGIINRGARN